MRSANGGPAFPIPGLQHDEDFNGMSLRDYFAAYAASGLLAHPDCRNVGPGHEMATICVASEAYSIADAMLAERAK
jgi:hypothetical protein